MRHYVLGVGGVGSFLVAKLNKIATDIILLDGDKYEEKNLDRQLFSPSDIGKNKAVALAELYGSGIKAVPSYFFRGMEGVEFSPKDYIFCCADNHTCRKAVLETADQYGCHVIIGANEYTDAEAYYYHKSMKDTKNDPRIFYPNILSDTTGDPLAPQSCTGNAIIANPQLVLANDWASAQMLHLYWFHTRKRPELDVETKEFWPIHHTVNIFKFMTGRIKDKLEG